ncbi:MAG: glycosyltransferase, partial [Candidatus Omnitrophica bacterium]|nr:glycosyltransferase [Candidatus Omnitrophota bacterium]
KNAVLLVNFGFPNPWKGLENLCNALKILVKKNNYYLLLLYSMRDDGISYAENIKSLVKVEGLEDRVIWLEALDEDKVSGVLKASDIFVAPYLDGASVRRGSLIAAIVHGMAIVTTFPRVKVEYLKNNENMIMVKPEDPSILSSAIEELSRDATLYQRLKTNIKALEPIFNWRRIAEETLKVY